MKNWFKGFEMNQSEIKAVWLLCAIIFLGFIGSLVWQSQLKPAKTNVSAVYLDSLVAKLEVDSTLTETKKDTEYAKKQRTEVFSFDPNTIGVDSLLLLGLKNDVANRFVNYRKAIGGFSSKDDVKKIYGLSDSVFQHLTELMHPQSFSESDSNLTSTISNFDSKKDLSDFKKNKEVSETLEIELNSATAQDLMRIRGIGSVLSKRIIKYRNALGGFHTVEQLFDVYGVYKDSINFGKVELMTDPFAVKRLNVNTSTKSELAAHPLISWYQAKTIVAYRDQHGLYDNISDITLTKVLTAEEIEALSPYITTE